MAGHKHQGVVGHACYFDVSGQTTKLTQILRRKCMDPLCISYQKFQFFIVFQQNAQFNYTLYLNFQLHGTFLTTTSKRG